MENRGEETASGAGSRTERERRSRVEGGLPRDKNTCSALKRWLPPPNKREASGTGPGPGL